MHASALRQADRFFRTYAMDDPLVVDIGAQDVNGSIRSVCPHRYVGVDCAPGAGVDVVLDDPYRLPQADESVDIVVSSSCFEHSEFFWIVFLEILRVLKPHGLLYLNAPSNGDIHRFPVDCWRFYPDAAEALAKWGRRNGYECQTLEHFTANRSGSVFNDYIAVFIKDGRHADLYPRRMLESFDDYRNGSDGRRATAVTQDQSTLSWLIRRASIVLGDPYLRADRRKRIFGR
jgi:SAM-dependent methyltransferase